MSSPQMRYLRMTAILALLALLLLPALASAQTQPPACSGTYYNVQRGDTWNSVAQATGVTLAELIRANPQAVRPNSWLWIGDRLCIPARGAPTSTPTQPATGIPPAAPAQPASGGYWYQVKPGDTWNSVSTATGVSVRDLWSANPDLLDRLYWLYIGQRVWVPSIGGATPAPGAQATATPAPQARSTPTPATPAPTPGSCASSLAGYPALILTYLNTPGNTPGSLRDWLTQCNVIIGDPDAVTTAALQSATSADLVVTLNEPPDGSGLLLVYHSSPSAYKLAHKAESSGRVALLTVTDLNADRKPDIVWTDTSCGAHTCFTTLYVDSWDGTTYADWIVGEPTIASAEYRFQDIVPTGSGQEIIVHGGVIGSVGAGPQRAWTETYISANGASYTLFEQVYDASTCLYHAILDANAAFDTWAAEGFEPAITAYTDAIKDQTLTACGTIANELATLRDFARFRLTVALVGNGQQADAQAILAQITTPALRGAANAFNTAYRTSRSIIQACRDTNTYAQANPASWQFLADWGYANPTFAAEDLCPIR